jgi:uncharacterized Zn ribbon protein
MLEECVQHCLQSFGIEVADDATVMRDGNGATFLRDDDGDSVTLLSHAEGSPVA